MAQLVSSAVVPIEHHELTPPLFVTTKKFMRANRISKLRALGSTYAAQTALLASVIESLSKQQKTLFRLSTECHNIAAPIASLPDEILQDIFLYVSEDLGASSQKAIPQLSLTCRYWRDIVVSYQRLWGKLGGWSHDLENIGRYLKRSGPAVHLHIKERPVVWTADRSLTNKVINLTVTSNRPNKLLDVLTGSELKNCTALRLLCPSPSGIGMINILTVGLPALTSLFLSATSFDKFLVYDGERTTKGQFKTIKHLEIHNAALKLPNDMSAIATNFPSLERLVLKRNSTQDFPLLGPTPPMPDSLRTLRLDEVHADISNQFMSRFKPVTLTELNVKFPPLDKENFGGDKMTFHEFMGFLPTMVPKVAQSIKAMVMGIDAMEDLETIKITGPHTLIRRIVEELGMNDSPFTPLSLPKLRHVELRLTNGARNENHDASTGHHVLPSIFACGMRKALSKLVKKRKGRLGGFDVLIVSNCMLDKKSCENFVEKIVPVHCPCIKTHYGKLEKEKEEGEEEEEEAKGIKKSKMPGHYDPWDLD